LFHGYEHSSHFLFLHCRTESLYEVKPADFVSSYWLDISKSFQLFQLHPVLCMMSGFCCKVDENFSLLGCYGARSGTSIPTFWNNLFVPSSRVKNPRRKLVIHYMVYIRKGVGGDKISVAWCLPVRLMQEGERGVDGK